MTSLALEGEATGDDAPIRLRRWVLRMFTPFLIAFGLYVWRMDTRVSSLEQSVHADEATLAELVRLSKVYEGYRNERTADIAMLKRAQEDSDKKLDDIGTKLDRVLSNQIRRPER